MRIRFSFVLLYLFFSGLSFAQKSFGEKSELGFFAGAMYYTGELNRMGHFRQMSPAGSLIFRYNLHPRLALRANATYGRIKGADALSKNTYYQERNLSFESILAEGAFGIEFNYQSYVTGRTYGERYWYTAYMFTQLAGFYFNPTAVIDGATYELQPLGTEGQGTVLSNQKNYLRFQMAVPIGLGFKLNLSKRVQFNIEYGARMTFTDYLDDVGGNYVDPALLAAINGQTAASASDPSLDAGTTRVAGMPRGDGVFNDWYAFFGAGVTFKLGVRAKCPMREQ